MNYSCLHDGGRGIPNVVSLNFGYDVNALVATKLCLIFSSGRQSWYKLVSLLFGLIMTQTKRGGGYLRRKKSWLKCHGIVTGIVVVGQVNVAIYNCVVVLHKTGRCLYFLIRYKNECCNANGLRFPPPACFSSVKQLTRLPKRRKQWFALCKET